VALGLSIVFWVLAVVMALMSTENASGTRFETVVNVIVAMASYCSSVYSVGLFFAVIDASLSCGASLVLGSIAPLVGVSLGIWATKHTKRDANTQS